MRFVPIVLRFEKKNCVFVLCATRVILLVEWSPYLKCYKSWRNLGICMGADVRVDKIRPTD